MGGHKVFEYGEFVENGERSDLNDITQMIESGATDRDIQLAYPSQFFRYYKNIAQLRQVYLETKFNDVFRELETTYIYGSTEKAKCVTLWIITVMQTSIALRRMTIPLLTATMGRTLSPLRNFGAVSK